MMREDVKAQAETVNSNAKVSKAMAKRAVKDTPGRRILAKGISVSNDSYVTKLNNNDLIVGSSGSGKTTGYVCPNLDNIAGSLVVCDTKSRLFKKYKPILKRKGYRVECVDFVNPENSTVSYNPLAFIRKNKDGSYREQDILSLANTLCPRLDKTEAVWDLSCQDLVAFYIAYCLETQEEEDKNLLTVSDMHKVFSQTDGDIQFLDYIEDNPDTFASKKYYTIKAMRTAEKMFSSIVGFVNVNLASYEFGEAKYIFGSDKPAIDIKSLGTEKTCIFINISDTDSTFVQLQTSLYTQMLQTLCTEADKTEDGRLPVGVRIMMDDFAAGSGSAIPDFAKIISIIRSRNISVSIMIQNIAQLESQYNKPETRTIVSNCDHLLYLGSNDVETADFIAARACKTPESVLAMPQDKAILITSGQKGQLVDRILPGVEYAEGMIA